MIPQCSHCGKIWNGTGGTVCPACQLQSGLPTAGELYAAFATRYAGSPPSRFEELCDKHPQFAEELRSLHQIALSARQARGSDPTASHVPDPNPGAEVPDAITNTWPSGSRYRVEGIVARGGMGIIYAVRDRELDRTLAMKVIGMGSGDHPPIALEELPPAWVDRFVEEAQITAQLDHPGIVPVHEIGLDPQGRLYFTMKLVKGRCLSDIFRLAREKTEGWNLSRAIRALLQACEAVGHAHQHGVIHRDLKPDNIMVGDMGEVYVMDWGVARSARRKDLHELRPKAAPTPLPYNAHPAGSPSTQPEAANDSPIVTQDGTVLGTPAYMSPEHAQGRVEVISPRSDVYSLGAILYELLSGHGPYLDDTPRPTSRQVLDAARSGPPSSITLRAKNQPTGLIAICAKAMERDPQARYAHAAELAEDLRAWLDRRVVRAHQTGALAELKAWILRNRLAAVTQVAAVALLITGLMVVIVLQDRSKRRIAEGLAALEQSHFNLRQTVHRANMIRANHAIQHDSQEAARAILTTTDPAFRTWEWQYLQSQLPSFSDLPIPTSGGNVRAVLSQDSEWLVTIDWTRTLQVLDARTMSPRRPPIVLPDPPYSLALSPDQRHVAVGSTNGILRLILLADGSIAWSAPAHTHRIGSLLFHPDGTRLISGGHDGFLRAWNVSDGTSITRAELGGSVTSLDFHPSGRSLVACTTLDAPHILDTLTLQPIHSRIAVQGPANAAVFSPDGTRIVSGGKDGQIHLWETDSGQSVPNFVSPPVLGPVSSLAWSPNRTNIGVGIRANLIQLIDSDSGRIVSSFQAKPVGLLYCLQFNTNGHLLLASGARGRGGNRLIRIGRTNRNTTITGHTNRIWSAAFTPDSRRIVTAGFDSTLILSDASDGHNLLTFRGHTNSVVWSVTITSDGRRAISAGQDGTLRVWNLESGAEERTFRAQPYPAVDENITLFVAASPDGSRIVSGGVDGHVQVWNLATGDRIWGARNHSNRLWSVAWSPDGNHIAAGGANGSLTLWNASRGSVLWHTNVDHDTIATVAFRPDGRELLSSHWESELRLWDPVTGELVRQIPTHEPLTRSASYSSDGRLIASGGFGREVRIWDASSGESVLQLPKEPRNITFVLFSPDGKRLVSCNADHTARVWQTE